MTSETITTLENEIAELKIKIAELEKQLDDHTLELFESADIVHASDDNGIKTMIYDNGHDNFARVINSEDINVRGSSLMGVIETTYDKLVERFGEPTYDELSGDGKTSTEWNLEITTADAIHKVTIYDYKSPSRDECRNGVYRWHIGGFNSAAVDVVKRLI